MDPLKSIRIASPCLASWERMAGDDRARHCTLCDLNVYNFAELTRDEIRDLVARTEGRLCARLYRRSDGTLLTKDCPTGLRRLQRRMSRTVAAVIAALFSASAFLTGCATGIRRNRPNMTLLIEQAAKPQLPLFAGVVTIEGNPLPGVNVVLRDEATQREIAAVTDANGAFSITAPREGIYRVEATLESLTPAIKEHVVLRQNEITRAQVLMHLNRTTETITVGAIAVTPSNEILSSTYSQDFIDKLPH